MVEYVLKRIDKEGLICFLPPDNAEAREEVRRELRRCRERHFDMVRVTLDAPRWRRTTGDGSQNHHLNGHIVQICNATGNTYGAVKYCVKMIAVEQMGYPFETVQGRVFPKGEADCDTAECAMLIEASHVLAAQLGIILRE